MKKIKKSLVVLPAIATMALTTVASVTGTVAWFTATQSVTFTAGSFGVKNVDGDLTVSATAGDGTEVATGNNGAVNVITNNVLLDASFDGTQTWTDIQDGSESTGLYKKVSNQYVSGSTYWYAVTWTETFTVKVENGVTDTYNIYFDCKATSASSDKDTKTGFRVSMVAGSGNRLVVAPFLETATAASEGYVSDEKTTSKYTAAADKGTKTGSEVYVFGSEYMSSGTNEFTKGVAKDSSATNRIDYLGTTVTSGTDSTLSVKFTAWFEGLDSNVVNDKSLDTSLSVQLGFYARLAN